MKLQIFKKLIPIACLLVSMNVLAYDFESGGIYYNITSSENKTVEVTYKDTDYNSYSGEVTIPSSVTHEEIEYSVTSIGDEAFQISPSLTSVTIGNSVASIGIAAFSMCDNLASITIPQTITSIHHTAFVACRNLTEMIVETGNPTYDSRENCNAIIETATNTLISGCKNTIIPNTVTSIGQEAFKTCYGLTNVTIPNSVTCISDYAFNYCFELTEIICESATPPNIGEWPFNNNATDRKIYVPAESVEDYKKAEGWNAYADVIIPYNFEQNNNNKITYITNDGEIVTPKNDAFNVNITSNIYENGLGTITFDGNVSTIGDDAFYKCYNLMSITIPNTVTSIGEQAFSFCGITSIAIPNSVTDIESACFYSCESLESITIGKSVENIDGSMFSGCENLASITVDADNEKYDSRDNCNAIIETATNTLVVGGKNTVFHNTVTSIGIEAFNNRYNITSITIPKTITNIHHTSFVGCRNLTEMIVEAGNPTYDSRDNCNAIIETATNTLISGCKNTIIPNTVASIGEKAFARCYDMTSINIPNSVTSIGAQAFFHCSTLTSINIPNSVTSIDDRAFDYCRELTEIICESATPPTAYGDTFLEIPTTATLYVPTGSKEAYASAEGWKTIQNIVEVTYPITSISLEESSKSLMIGDIVTLQAIITPTNATNQELVWTSSDENVATVDDNGLVTAVAVGSATITATTTDGSDLSAVCEITVSEVYRFAAENATTFKGKSIMLPVNLVNSGNVSAFQFDIYLPEGITIPFDEEEEEYLMTLNPERATDTHSVLTNKQANGAIRYICNSSKSEAFAGESGTELFSIPLNISNEIEGEFNIEFKNIKLSSSDAEVRNCEDVSVAITVKPYSLGDSNGDDNINIADIVNITNYVLGKPTKTFIEIASDVNKDGDINIGDVVGTVNLVLNTSPSTKSMVSSKQVYQKAVAVEASSQESVFINDFTICANESKTIEVNMTNSNTYSGLEFNLHLPEGLTVDYDEEEEEYLFGKTSRLTGSHSINYNKVADNVFRFVIYSSSSKNIKLNEGAIMTIPFTASADMPEGGYQIEIKEVVVSTSEADDYEFGNTVANITVCPDPMTGINDIVEDNTEVEYYNLQGVKVAKENLTQGVYIKKQGTKAVKVMLK